MPGISLRIPLLVSLAMSLLSACTAAPPHRVDDVAHHDRAALHVAIAEREAAAAGVMRAIERYCTLREPGNRHGECVAEKRAQMKIDERFDLFLNEALQATEDRKAPMRQWLQCEGSSRGTSCRRSEVAVAQLWETELRRNVERAAPLIDLSVR